MSAIPLNTYRVYKDNELIFEGSRRETASFLNIVPFTLSKIFSESGCQIVFYRGYRIEVEYAKDGNSIPAELLIEWDREVAKWKKTFHQS